MFVPQVSPPANQAAAIAYRRTPDAVEICLIRRQESPYWGIPKGVIEDGDTEEETALNEAFEEAGIEGQLVGDALGLYAYQKRGLEYTVAVYLMEVYEAHDDWDERPFRVRRWASLREAARLLADHPVRYIFQQASRLLDASREPR